ncbi:hypothetical protein ACJRO7_029979 [Eucalyptus globulus]|uniref:beta-galactosidase n=1 Tax=Eucalyptus globulus TaxID=34317 RepID=A0ABD3JDM9_EUCGL
MAASSVVAFHTRNPTSNRQQPFKTEMQRFTVNIVDMMKQEKLYASRGGPFVLSQIENEYGNVASAYGSGAEPYVNRAAAMATSLGAGVPWVKCQQMLRRTVSRIKIPIRHASSKYYMKHVSNQQEISL